MYLENVQFVRRLFSEGPCTVYRMTRTASFPDLLSFIGKKELHDFYEKVTMQECDMFTRFINDILDNWCPITVWLF